MTNMKNPNLRDRAAKKRAFTFTEIIIAMLLIGITATLSLTLYNTAYDTNKAANDTCFLELIQIDILEDLQEKIDEGQNLQQYSEVQVEAGRLIVQTELTIDQSNTRTGTPYYYVQAVSRIKGASTRKLVTKVVMTRQTGDLFYENQS